MLMKCMSCPRETETADEASAAAADEASAAANINRIDAFSFFSSCVILPNKG